MKNKITYHDGEHSNLGINPLIEITDFGSTQFAECMNIYESSFPFNETRPAKKVKEMLGSDRYYHLFASVNRENRAIGISLMYTFKELGFGLLDYIAVTSNYQSKGIGRQLFEFALTEFKSDVQTPQLPING